MPDGVDFPPEVAVTAWVADPRIAVAADPFSLLVLTREQQGHTGVHDAWRVYHSDVNIANAKSALDVLVFFLQRYGMDVQIAGTTSKLFMYSRMPLAPGTSAVQVLGAKDGMRISSSQLMKIDTSTNPPVAEVAVVFAVNEGAIEDDLALHGVFLRSKPPKR
jgi:hypothetical protein